MKSKIYLLLLTISILLFLTVSPTFAHPGNTASDGCHYCRTNCDSWGEVYGARHCHGGSSYSPPSYDYSPPSSTHTYNCPAMSYYDSVSGSCKCYSGYVASGDKCISEDQWCQDKYGYGAASDYLDSCKCRYGYVWGKDYLGSIKCISGNDACVKEYGVMSTYDSLSENCGCLPGYVFGKDIIGTTQCITEDRWCQNKYGFNSEYNTLNDKCECRSGYEFTVQGSGLTCESCFSIYGLNSSYDYIKNKCACNEGYTLDGNKCISSEKKEKVITITCPINSTSISGQCFCNDGYEWDHTQTSCMKRVEIKTDTPVIKEDSVNSKLVVKKEVQQEQETFVKKEETQITTENKDNQTPVTINKQNFLASLYTAIKNIFVNLFKGIF